MTTIEHRVDRAGLAEGVFRDTDAFFAHRALSQAARDSYADRKASIREHVGASAQEDADLDELRSKADLLPGPGYERLRREAQAQAANRKQVASWRWDDATKAHEAALIDDALPTFNKERESLARQELAIAIGEAKGQEAASRAQAVIGNGSREAVALLLRDPFGRTLLEARGLTGRDLEETLSSGRKYAAALAIEKGATERERAAAEALRRLGTLGAARGAAGR